LVFPATPNAADSPNLDCVAVDSVGPDCGVNKDGLDVACDHVGKNVVYDPLFFWQVAFSGERPKSARVSLPW
jgi:hypothetical protein